MAKKDVDVRFNLIDNFTSSFNKTDWNTNGRNKKGTECLEECRKGRGRNYRRRNEDDSSCYGTACWAGRCVGVRIW